MTRIIAIANQKGGVAKTTTVASIGAALAELGQRVLLVDLDPQACLTFSLGLDPETLELSMHDVLLGRIGAAMAVIKTDEDMDLLPATIDLAGTEAQLLTRTGREYALRTALDDVAAEYDSFLLDCSPSLGVLTINALTAADEVLIPLQCETLSHRGVGQLLDTIDDVRRITNRDLVVLGVLPTLFDSRTNHSRAVLADINDRYGLDILARRSRGRSASPRRPPPGVRSWRPRAAPRRAGLPAARARTGGREPLGPTALMGASDEQLDFDRVRPRAATEPSVAGVDARASPPCSAATRSTRARVRGHHVLGLPRRDRASYAGRCTGAAEPAPAGRAPGLPLVDALPRLRRAPLGEVRFH